MDAQTQLANKTIWHRTCDEEKQDIRYGVIATGVNVAEKTTQKT